MKLNYKLSLAVFASLAIVLPMSAFAEDKKQDEKKQETKKRHGAEVAPQGAAHASPQSGEGSRAENVRNEGRVKTVHQPNVAPATGQSVQPSKRLERNHRDQTQPNVAPMTSQSVQPTNRPERSQRNQPQSNVAPTTSRNLQSSDRLERAQRSQAQVYSNQKSYNRSNNYGGLWFAENTHSDWKRDSHYYWNHHNYRWYEGGWLIIDGGYSPYGFNSGSTASNVQMSLANQGYYNGAIDGDIGPASRNAIADYQSDHDLRVTGHINDPLLQSLQLE